MQALGGGWVGLRARVCVLPRARPHPLPTRAPPPAGHALGACTSSPATSSARRLGGGALQAAPPKARLGRAKVPTPSVVTRCARLASMGARTHAHIHAHAVWSGMARAHGWLHAHNGKGRVRASPMALRGTPDTMPRRPRSIRGSCRRSRSRLLPYSVHQGEGQCARTHACACTHAHAQVCDCSTQAPATTR